MNQLKRQKTSIKKRTDLLSFCPSGNISFTFPAQVIAARLGTLDRLFIQCDSPPSSFPPCNPFTHDLSRHKFFKTNLIKESKLDD